MLAAKRLLEALSALMESRPDGLHLLSGLLFVEVGLLAGMTGILAWRFPAPGLFCFCLLVWLDMPRRRFFVRKGNHCLALALCFLLCCGYTALREATPPPVPDWLERAVAQYSGGQSGDAAGSGKAARPQSLMVTARVAECIRQPGKRLRVILEDISPVPEQGGENATRAERDETAAPYKGGVVWTWNNFDPQGQAVLPGQRLALNLRFLGLRSFANPGLWNPEEYWKDRGVFFRGLASDKESPVVLSPLATEDLGLFYSVRNALAVTRLDLLQRFLAALPERSEASGILPALVFGDRSLMTSRQGDLFARSTLAHSLALSGLHMGFVVLVGMVLSWGTGLLFPRLWLRLTRPGLALLFALPLALGYLWLGESPVSLQRAAYMLFFSALLFFLRRPSVIQDGLFAALAFILAMNPLALFELSLQLSAFCIAVLALCFRHITYLAARLFPLPEEGVSKGAIFRKKFLRGACVIFGTSLCIQVALLPLTVRAFGSSGVFFPLNMLWLPVLGTIIMPLAFLGFLATALGLDSLAALALHAASLPCDGLLLLLEWLDRAGLLVSPLLPRPLWVSALGYWLLCLALPAFCLRLLGKSKKLAQVPVEERLPIFKKTAVQEAPESGKKSAAGAGGSRLYEIRAALPPVLLGLVLLLSPLPIVLWENSRTAVQLKVLDVGQGQSVLVEWSGLGGDRPGGRVLIDGGGLGSEFFDIGKAVVAPVLTDNRLPSLYAVINSHPDRDHLEGLLFLLEHFYLEHYFVNGDEPSPALAEREERALSRGGLQREVLSAGDRLELAPGLHIETVWPPGNASGKEWQGKEKRNDKSLVLRLVWQGRGLALIPGDVGKNPLRSLAENAEPDLSAEVLLLPHHGSGNSLSPLFYSKVRPVLAVASCGTTSAWRYPAQSVRVALRDSGASVCSTAERGQVAVRWSSPEVSPEITFALPLGQSEK